MDKVIDIATYKSLNSLQEVVDARLVATAVYQPWTKLYFDGMGIYIFLRGSWMFPVDKGQPCSLLESEKEYCP